MSKVPAFKCLTCKDTGWAWQYRRYGDQQYHGNYYERCDDCAQSLTPAEPDTREHD